LLRGEQSQLHRSGTARRSFNVVGSFEVDATRRAVTWDDFKQAFKSHHIPKGLMDRKMRELLALRQGSDTVYRYAQKFNSLC
jgi:hypothetical protein